MSRQTKYTNTHTPKNTPHILPGKAVSAFEFAYSDKRQMSKNASVSSLLGQQRLGQYLSFSKKCRGVTQEFTLSHHSRPGEIPIYYLLFFWYLATRVLFQTKTKIDCCWSWKPVEVISFFGRCRSCKLLVKDKDRKVCVCPQQLP